MFIGLCIRFKINFEIRRCHAPAVSFPAKARPEPVGLKIKETEELMKTKQFLFPADYQTKNRRQ
jgi:hypothetical protein